MSLSHVLVMEPNSPVCSEDHSGQLARLLCGYLSARSIDLRTVTHCPDETLSPAPDLIVLRSASTVHLPDVVQRLRRNVSRTPILGLFCSGKDTPVAVMQSLAHGLDDFLSCPLRDVEVLPRVLPLLQTQRKGPHGRSAAKRESRPHVEGLIGTSVPFLQVVRKVLGVAHADATVLIAGETGTGKELIARAIHYHSARRAQPFVPVNCGAVPDHLFENELFGHVKGAFTDASSPEEGLIAAAEGGTLFLDEVDALSAAAQVKVLRFLQEREYRPLGSTKNRTANVRIVAATNSDLWHQVQTQHFRMDLYYRLNILAFRLPPLRERPEDIPLLAAHFLRRYRHQYGREPLRLSLKALHKLEAYSWPGNVRELETVIQRAVIFASSPVLQSDDIELPSSSHHATMTMGTSLREAKARVVEQFERAYLTNLLSTHEGNVTRAARHAGKERRAFQRLLQRYELDRCIFQS